MIRSMLLAAGLFAHLSAAETLLVPEQYSTVNQAVENSSSGDTILISDGFSSAAPWELPHELSFVGATGPNKPTVFSNSRLLNAGGGPPVRVENLDLRIKSFGDVTNATILNCGFIGEQSLEPLFDLPLGISPSYEITNCTFSDFDNVDTTGGVLRSPVQYDNFILKIHNCIFENCDANSGGSASGGAIHLRGEEGSVEITECQFIGCNSSDRGGAFRFDLVGGSALISDCDFINCSASSGGGLYIDNGTTPQISNCRFTNNTALNNPGGGLWAATAPMEISGCDFTGNVSVSQGGGLFHQGPASNVFATSCTFNGNSASVGGGVAGAITVRLCTFCENTPSPVSVDVIISEGNIFNGSCGSCCIGGACIPSTEEVCSSSGGDFVNSDCADANCPSPIGACCTNGDCLNSTIESCFKAGGSFAGFGTTCTDIECPAVCEGDVSGNGSIDYTDLLILISNWGNCPG
jgi:hypothetical protein